MATDPKKTQPIKYPGLNPNLSAIFLIPVHIIDVLSSHLETYQVTIEINRERLGVLLVC